MRGDGLDIEVLTCIVLYAWKEDQGSGGRVFVDRSENVGGADGCD